MSGTFDREALPDWLAYADARGIKVEGRGTWRSILCDFHSDTHASLRINTKTGGWCCMSCGESGGDTIAHYMRRTGLGFVDAAQHLGAWKSNGAITGREKARTLSARDGLELLYADALLVAVVARDIGRGKTPSDGDLASVAAASKRVLVVYEGVTQ